MRMPRLLPLVAVAAGGVLAINAVENGPGIFGAARSFAEGVAHKSAAAAPPTAASAIAPDASVGPAAENASATPAPACVESPAQLAKEAGLSPAELQVIQSLGARRGELDQREQGLSTELALIQAAEAKVDARIATMTALKADMQTLVGQLDDKQQAEVDRLVKVYEAMIKDRPQDAADRFIVLSDEVRLPVAAKLKERLLSQMMQKMSPPEAKRLTESLAARYVAQAAAARQAINPPPAQPAAPPPPPPQTTQAAPPPATSAAATPAPKAKPTPAVHRKPKKPTPPKRTIAAAPPEPVWPPKPAPGTPPAPPKSASATPPPPKSASATPAPTVAKAATAAPAAPTPPKSG